MKSYTVKAGDTISVIARKHGLTVAQVMAVNPQIVDRDRIQAGHIISLPDAAEPRPRPDIHGVTNTTLPLPVASLLARARSVLNKQIRYELGAGGMLPTRATPANIHNRCDCSGYIAWCFGVSRQTTHPLYVRFNNGWINTDAMVNDAKSENGFFRQLSAPKVGCIVVFPGPPRRAIGHVGIVTEVSSDGTKVNKVIHCSLGNDRAHKDSVQETPPNVFRQPDTIYAWYEGIDD